MVQIIAVKGGPINRLTCLIHAKPQILTMPTTIDLIPALSDNYVYLIRWNDSALVVDPAEARPVLGAIQKAGVTLLHIINTHHHSDHVAGNAEVKAASPGCTIIGPDDPRIPDLDRTVGGGDELVLGPLVFDVLHVPGHTDSHIAFFLRSEKWLLAGDSIFAGGCGRLFEGTPAQMHASLQTISALPDETLIFCGHEYTQKNLEFAASLEPDNGAVSARLEDLRNRRRSGEATIPSTLAEEKRTNPFLRSHESGLRAAVGLEAADDVDVFAEVRSRRNNF
jgi:hydroxyacylglutathione hydrolase